MPHLIALSTGFHHNPGREVPSRFYMEGAAKRGRRQRNHLLATDSDRFERRTPENPEKIIPIRGGRTLPVTVRIHPKNIPEQPEAGAP